MSRFVLRCLNLSGYELLQLLFDILEIEKKRVIFITLYMITFLVTKRNNNMNFDYLFVIISSLLVIYVHFVISVSDYIMN